MRDHRYSKPLSIGVLAGLCALGLQSFSFAQTSPGAYIQPADEAALARLSQAIQIETITYDDQSRIDWQSFTTFQAFLEASFPDLHRVTTRERFNHSAWLYTWPGSTPSLEPILLIAHQDVVPIEAASESEWTHPPFAGTRADGYIWGRGTLDMKGHLMAVMEALNTLAASGYQPERTILIGLGDDEEVGGEGARQIASHLSAHHIHPLFILDEGLMVLDPLSLTEKPAAMIGVGEKGFGTLRIVAEGQSGHSSRPPFQTAPGQLARALLALEEVKFKTDLDPLTRSTLGAIADDFEGLSGLAINNLWLFGPMVKGQLMSGATGRALLSTTLAPTMLEGSPKANALAQYAEALVNVRLHPRDTPEGVLSLVETALADIEGISVSWADIPNGAPTPSDINSPVFERLKTHVSGLYETPISMAPTLVIGGTDARAYQGLSPNIYRFQPVVISEDDAARMHGVNERISEDNYGRMIAFFSGLVRDFTQAPE
ncbi:M20/M25/M40 family metallo-hydrolase [Woodsholea maritima]|uniref:M20/M25/M40 family metallo-hydrolase n=1 Tax=Woodsholea maritima TaxID=240237 RepID=UPI00036E2E4B|nr:M20/M25/M40 family metallo-hydrolase [Woodsholea maritima]